MKHSSASISVNLTEIIIKEKTCRKYLRVYVGSKGLRELIKGSFAYLIWENNAWKAGFAQELGASTCSARTDSFFPQAYLLPGKTRKNIFNLKLKHQFDTSRCIFLYSKVASQCCILFDSISPP